ncbi:MAG: hypothetical protein M3N00_03460, partial [Actinomycetota bacterium]|nr:hypothetical protein [Actinomycetota bacterium]
CVSKEGLAARDRLVLESCRERGIPVAVTMAGGYAREVEDTVDIHFRSIERAATLLNPERGIDHIDDARPPRWLEEEPGRTA